MAFTTSPQQNAERPDSIFHRDEEVIELEQIQGNVLGGFKAARQKLIFLRVPQTEEGIGRFRAWLSQAKIATARQVIEYNTAAENGTAAALDAPWLNIAFSHSMLRQLTKGRAEDLERADFEDEAFKAGMNARSKLLGDPLEAHERGNPATWVVGGAQPVDVMLTLAHDDGEVLETHAQSIRSALPDSVVHTDDGATLGRGREHFGFQDGISQPGLRGYVSRIPPVALAARRNSSNVNQGWPGQDLIWPGEFVFGYFGEADRAGAASGHSDLAISAGPAWAKNGSFVVFRRLEQRVSEFHRFVDRESKRRGFPALWFASMLFGRWPSGAPRLRTPEIDHPELGASSCANNNFSFRTPTAPLPDGACADSAGGARAFAPARADHHGSICMFAAHIRRMYARDDQPRELAQRRRLLRRGMPYGPVSRSTIENPVDDDGQQRGLLFVAYQTSFVRQFEAVTQQANDPNFGQAGAGRDAIIGQNSVDADRSFILDGKTLTPLEPWVIPTGGEYFFAPSLSILRLLSNP